MGCSILFGTLFLVWPRPLLPGCACLLGQRYSVKTSPVLLLSGGVSPWSYVAVKFANASHFNLSEVSSHSEAGFHSFHSSLGGREASEAMSEEEGIQ